MEDDITPVVLFKAALSTYEGLGAIYVPPIPQQTDLDHGNWAGHCVWATGRVVCLLPQWLSVGLYSTGGRGFRLRQLLASGRRLSAYCS